MNERDIIIDPIITHNNYLIEVAPDEFVNVTQLWKEYKQIVKDKKDLQNRIDNAIEFTKKERKRENNTQPKDILDQQFKNGFTSALAQVEDILKEN